MKRFLEVIPGFCSWLILISFIGLFILRPVVAAVLMIVFLLYWVCRLLYISILLVMAHHRVLTKSNKEWLKMCEAAKSDLNFKEITHLVLYAIYKESQKILEDSLDSLKESQYPKDKIIVVLAGEERATGSFERLQALKEKYKDSFRDILITIHPNKIEGEIPAKGANVTYAARRAREYLEARQYDFNHIIISCFDADTCVDKNYLGCLAYNFLSNPKRHRTSFQPFPVYSNNIYTAPAFARVMEMGSTFWQLIESMRYEKFITFSSHSMSFKTLVEVDYWPVDLISDDSLIFWKCFIKYDGDYRTYPLEVPVFMDIAVGNGFFDTIRVQYKQKRRWAWGVENFVFVGMEFLKKSRIPVFVKIKRLSQILDNHVNWATWAIIISFVTPLTLIWGHTILKNSLILFNLSYVNSIIFNALSLILILCVVISTEFLPPRPQKVSRFVYFIFVMQWALIPLISATLGCLPALDAQTRLMLGKYLFFNPTPKKR
jgi:hypothetical protein